MGASLERFWRAVRETLTRILRGLFVVWMTLTLISLAYKGLQWSSGHLPLPVHLATLVLYIASLIWLISLIATERSRRKYGRKIRAQLGPHGLLILPGFVLLVSAAVFASITWLLWQGGAVEFVACGGGANGGLTDACVEVREAQLLDFYTWHFLKLVPLLRLPELLRWPEPLCYSQSRLGFLILLFQACVVLPGIGAIRWYWRNRHAIEEELE